jgi:hypothetical protein
MANSRRKKDSRRKKGFNPTSDRVKELLSDTEPQVTPQQLLEIITECCEKQLPEMREGKARQNVLVLLIDVCYKNEIRSHITRAVSQRKAGRWIVVNPNDNSDRVEVLAKSYKERAGTTIVETVNPIDSPTGSAGGLTLLHEAAMEGDLEEVRKLVEVDGASVYVLDNMGMTPYDRARAYGNHTVAEYLKSKMK